MFARLKAPVQRFIYNAAKAAAEQALFEDSFSLRDPDQADRFAGIGPVCPGEYRAPQDLRQSVDLIDHCLKLIPPEGLILEFGVFKGKSLGYMAERLPRHQLFGFDTFEGLPEPWFIVSKGVFEVDGPPSLPKNVGLIKGLFQDTAKDFLAESSREDCFTSHGL